VNSVSRSPRLSKGSGAPSASSSWRWRIVRSCSSSHEPTDGTRSRHAPTEILGALVVHLADASHTTVPPLDTITSPRWNTSPITFGVMRNGELCDPGPACPELRREPPSISRGRYRWVGRVRSLCGRTPYCV
jgi:hypothetical protein